jgi:membrane protease YdiL (CAAX protease family)
LPSGVAPILLSAIPFALLHARPATSSMQPHELLALLAVNTMANLATLMIAVLMLRGLGQATWTDLGLDKRRTGVDLCIGGLAVVAVLGPAYATQYGLQLLLAGSVVTDPVPLFLLALALGYIYHRTHRLLPVFVLHALFNAFAFVSLWLTA